MEHDSWEEDPSFQPKPKGWANPTLLLLLDYWRVIAKHWYIVAGLTLLVVAINSYRVFRQESVYFSQAAIEVRPGRLALGEQAFESNFSYTAQSFVRTQMTVAESRAVAELVVAQLGIDKTAEMLGRPKPVDQDQAAHDRIVDALLLSVSAEQLRDTFIISIGIESTSPDTAALLANTYAESLIEFNRDAEIEFSQSTSEALSKQVERLQASIKEKEARLTKIAGAAQIQVLDQQLNVTMQDLQSLGSQLQTVQKEVLEKQTNLQRIQKTDPNAIPEITGNPSVAAARSGCTAAEQLYTEQSRIFKPDWPGLQQLKIKKDEACSRVNSEVEAAHAKLLLQTQGELDATRSKEWVIRRDVETNKTEIEGLNQKTSDYQSLKADLDNEKRLVDQMMQRRQTTQLTEAGGMQGSALMRIVEMATPARQPIRPKRLQSILISLALGLGLGVGAAFAISLLNLKIHSHEEIERITNFRFLAFIPDMEKESHVGIEQNAFRYLTKHLSTIKFADIPPRVILVTSPEPKEGKTFISSNLALTLVSKGKRTLLLDTDIHRPSIHDTFQVPVSPGLADLLLEPGPPDFDIFPKPSSNLTIVPAGKGNIEALSSVLETARFSEIIRAALREYDQVIIDSGPLLVTPETLSVAQNADGVILVVRSNQTSTKALKVTADRSSSIFR